MHEINNIKFINLDFNDRSLTAASPLTNTTTLIELKPLVDGHFRFQTTQRNLLSLKTHTHTRTHTRARARANIHTHTHTHIIFRLLTKQNTRIFQHLIRHIQPLRC
jgi:hypothetical protein